MTDPQRILFVCMGNICRSPLAEGILQHRAAGRGVLDALVIDSAGTGGWHAGEMADARMRQTATARGVTLESRARQVTIADFTAFDLLLCMDDDNLGHLIDMGAPPARTHLLLEYTGGPVREVPDPYYGGADGFERVFDLVDEACAQLLDRLDDGGAS